MSPIHRNELRAANKARLFDDVLFAIRSIPEIIWSEVIREKSLILGQLRDGRPLGVVVKLPGQTLADSALAFLVAMNKHRGCGFVVHEVAEVSIWIRRLTHG